MRLNTQLPATRQVIDVPYQQALQQRLTELSIRYQPVTLTSDYAFQDTDEIDSTQVDATVQSVTITLPSPTGVRRRRVVKTDVSVNTVTVNGNGYLINGAATVVLAAQYTYIEVEPTGTGWLIISKPELTTGTVTSVSVTTANGVSGSVATPTTTPAITITLGAITPTSVAASGTVSGSNLSGTNTGDQTSVSGNAGTATALVTSRTIGGSNFNGTANVTSFPSPGPFGNTTPDTVAATTISATGAMNLSAATAGQISFPATQNASAGANVLDDYEEGTWTPAVGGTATYSQQTGNYTKIGNVVTFQMQLVINVIGTGSTTNISGLPFSSKAVNFSAHVGYWGSIAVSAVYLTGIINGTAIQLNGATSGTGGLTSPIAAMMSGTNLVITGTYLT